MSNKPTHYQLDYNVCSLNYRLFIIYLLNWPFAIWLLDFGLLQHILPGPSASWEPSPVSRITPWQGFLDLVLPTQTMSPSSWTSANFRIKYLSRRSILIHANDMVDPKQPLDVNMLHNVKIYKDLKQLTTATSSQQISGKNYDNKINLLWKVSQKFVIRNRLKTVDRAAHV